MPKSPQIPEEFKLLADSVGFGNGFERTYKMFALYVLGKDGSIELRGSHADRFFKSKRMAEMEAERINWCSLLRWDGKEYVPEKNPDHVAFAREIEVTERILR